MWIENGFAVVASTPSSKGLWIGLFMFHVFIVLFTNRVKNLVKIIFLYKSFFFFFLVFYLYLFLIHFHLFFALHIVAVIMQLSPMCWITKGVLFYSISQPAPIVDSLLPLLCQGTSTAPPHPQKKNIYPQSKKPKRWHNIVSTFSPRAVHNLIIVLWARVLLLWPSWCQNDNTLPALSCTQQDVASRPVWSELRCQKVKMRASVKERLMISDDWQLHVFHLYTSV